MEQSDEYELHPACALFPEMGPAELQALADDIRANGQRELILKLPNEQYPGRPEQAKGLRDGRR